MNRYSRALAVGMFALMLAACATPGGGTSPGEVEIRTGRIEQITMTEIRSNHDAGLGAVLGGVAGAGIGSLIGAGTGKDVAIAAGAIMGALGGNYAQKKYYEKPIPAQQVYVRLGSGVLVEITQPVNANLRVGMPVYIEGSGEEARVVPK
jgi:outer membrane lipoprotein SlyB